MTGNILIVDDVATNRIVLKVKLAQAFYSVLQAGSGTEALQMARTHRPDLILLDVMMPDLDGIAVCSRLKSDPGTARIPVIMVTSFTDSQARLDALRAGADDFLSKPIDETILLARVRSLLRARDTEEELQLRQSTCQELGLAQSSDDLAPRPDVALIAGSQRTAQAWKALLRDRTSALLRIPTVGEILKAVAPPPDLFVIGGDLEQPDGGLRLLSELRSRADTRHSASIMILRKPSHDQAVTALDLGANDLLAEDFDAEELALRIDTQIARKRAADRLRNAVKDGLRLAVTDPLTGLYNRRYALPHLNRIADRAAAENRSYAIMLLDLDRFKSVNDTFGHAAGDAVLREIARRLRDNLRGVDLVSRLGGEEFLVALPDTDMVHAKNAAERLRQVVEENPVQVAGVGRGISVTLSIGVSIGAGRISSTEALLERADRALYDAKAEGRNQVSFSLSAA